MAVSPIDVHKASDIERAVGAFACLSQGALQHEREQQKGQPHGTFPHHRVFAPGRSAVAHRQSGTCGPGAMLVHGQQAWCMADWWKGSTRGAGPAQIVSPITPDIPGRFHRTQAICGEKGAERGKRNENSGGSETPTPPGGEVGVAGHDAVVGVILRLRLTEGKANRSASRPSASTAVTAMAQTLTVLDSTRIS